MMKNVKVSCGFGGNRKTYRVDVDDVANIIAASNATVVMYAGVEDVVDNYFAVATITKSNRSVSASAVSKMLRRLKSHELVVVSPELVSVFDGCLDKLESIRIQRKQIREAIEEMISKNRKILGQIDMCYDSYVTSSQHNVDDLFKQLNQNKANIMALQKQMATVCSAILENLGVYAIECN